MLFGLQVAKRTGMPIERNRVEGLFNSDLRLPFELRTQDFALAIQDIYDFFFDVNQTLLGKGLGRLEDILEKRKATLSGLLSDLLTASLARHSRSLIENKWPNGHPDLILRGLYPRDAVKAGEQGVEVKSTKNANAAVDMHGARDQWLCVFVYAIDSLTEPAVARRPLNFSGVYLAQVRKEDFRKNQRGELGTRTATLNREGIRMLREKWLYRSPTAG
jgi:hypothetical protein